MLFLQYPPCSTCQKAKKWLDERAISYQARHIKEDNPSFEELKSWHAMSGLPLKRFFNTSGLLYKTMNLKERLPDPSRRRPRPRRLFCKASGKSAQPCAPIRMSKSIKAKGCRRDPAALC